MKPGDLIPIVDFHAVLADLEALGWRAYKIEAACGFSVGFLAQLRRRPNAQMFHANAVRLHNLWAEELMLNPQYVSAHTQVTTT